MFFLLGGGMIYITKGTSKEIETSLASDKLNPDLLNQNVYYAPEKKWWPAGMVGFGQTFALNKNWGFEWNLRWVIYYRKLIHEQNSSIIEGWTTDMHLSIGVNYYFPGVKYR